MTHIAAGRLDHISQTPSEAFPVKLTSKADGGVEFATMEYAVNRLGGYYAMRDDEIESHLRAGFKMQTISFIYQVER